MEYLYPNDKIKLMKYFCTSVLESETNMLSKQQGELFAKIYKEH